MERQRSNVGMFCFKYEELPENQEHQKRPENLNLNPSRDMREVQDTERGTLAGLHKTKLNYSQEDIHALASQAELLVLTGSNLDLRKNRYDCCLNQLA